MPQEIFRSPSFSKRLWEPIVDRAQHLRLKATLGERYAAGDSLKNIDASQDLQCQMDRDFPSWREILSAMFYFSDNLTLEELKGGYSGAKTLRVFARLGHKYASQEGQWLCKISPRPAKIYRELNAHLSTMRSGLEFARSVPPLWRSPIVCQGIGAIAYQFAADTKEAASMVDGDVAYVCRRVKKVLKALYRDTTKERSIRAHVLRDWALSYSALEEVLARCGVPSEFPWVADLVEGKEAGALGESVSYRAAWIHGDLHLGNVLFGDYDLLIDFAGASKGPVCIDAARLAVDLMIRRTDLRALELPNWDSSSHPLMQAFSSLKAVFKLGRSEVTLFHDFILLFLLAHLSYDSVDSETKTWIRASLSL